eukprot:gene8874-42937_t
MACSPPPGSSLRALLRRRDATSDVTSEPGRWSRAWRFSRTFPSTTPSVPVDGAQLVRLKGSPGRGARERGAREGEPGKGSPGKMGPDAALHRPGLAAVFVDHRPDPRVLPLIIMMPPGIVPAVYPEGGGAIKRHARLHRPGSDVTSLVASRRRSSARSD